MSNFVSRSFLHIHLLSSSHVMAFHKVRMINQMYINPGWPQRSNRQVESNIHPEEILKHQEPIENILFHCAGDSQGFCWEGPNCQTCLEWHPSSDFYHTQKNCKIPGLEGQGRGRRHEILGKHWHLEYFEAVRLTTLPQHREGLKWAAHAEPSASWQPECVERICADRMPQILPFCYH